MRIIQSNRIQISVPIIKRCVPSSVVAHLKLGIGSFVVAMTPLRGFTDSRTLLIAL